MRRIRRICERRSGQLKRIHSKAMEAVLSAAFALSLTSGIVPAYAQSAPEHTTARVKYVYYKDIGDGSVDRIKISSPMLWVNGALSDSVEFEAGAVYDAVSGASPLYLDSVSGASGTGIEDNRRAGDLKITKYFENYSIGLGGSISDEDDYLSRSGSLDARIWTPDKNTVFATGVSSDWDHITSSNNPDLGADRKTQHYLLGVTQVLNPQAIVQSNVTFTTGHGHYNDPYKLFENRPSSRQDVAWLTRFNYYFTKLDSSAHIDYRLFRDSWGVLAHMVALRYYQPLSANFTLVPMVRYYTQNGARFFLSESEIPPLDFEANSSADERLSSFGSITPGLKVIAKVNDSFEFDALYQYMVQASNLELGSSDDTFNGLTAHYFEVGMSVKF